MTKYTLINLCLIITIMLVFASKVYAFVYNDGYPYKDATQCQSDGTGCVVDPWNFYKRQCTSYAAYIVNENGVSMFNGMQGPNGLAGLFGNAGNWDNNASYIGYNVDNNPTVGSIAVWDPDACTGCTVGHVAYVRAVNSNGSVFISEYNWNWGDGNYSERDNLTASHYIHFSGGNSCGGANVIISNQTLNSGTTCIASNSISIYPESTITSSNGDINFKIQ